MSGLADLSTAMLSPSLVNSTLLAGIFLKVRISQFVEVDSGMEIRAAKRAFNG